MFVILHFYIYWAFTCTCFLTRSRTWGTVPVHVHVCWSGILKVLSSLLLMHMCGFCSHARMHARSIEFLICRRVYASVSLCLCTNWCAFLGIHTRFVKYAKVLWAGSSMQVARLLANTLGFCKSKLLERFQCDVVGCLATLLPKHSVHACRLAAVCRLPLRRSPWTAPWRVLPLLRYMTFRTALLLLLASWWLCIACNQAYLLCTTLFSIFRGRMLLKCIQVLIRFMLYACILHIISWTRVISEGHSSSPACIPIICIKRLQDHT